MTQYGRWWVSWVLAGQPSLASREMLSDDQAFQTASAEDALLAVLRGGIFPSKWDDEKPVSEATTGPANHWQFT
ncbi:unnamed protein product [Echinostoma caproni]|uniref:DUF2188 domain-containing protein n=1 Tax=Echinostoma caproni TaxID=27848 RepID=A0A183BGV6_9TREM|nr:unnamed protein product [Echinostoma caproni]